MECGVKDEAELVLMLFALLYLWICIDVLPCRVLSTRLLNFVGVNDGRVSRLHCVFRPEPSSADPSAQMEQTSTESDPLRNGQQQARQLHERSSLYDVPAKQPRVLLLDCSTNGTFINGARAFSQGLGTPLNDGDRVSLVLSVTPLVEQYLIFHAGEAPFYQADLKHHP